MGPVISLWAIVGLIYWAWTVKSDHETREMVQASGPRFAYAFLIGTAILSALAWPLLMCLG